MQALTQSRVGIALRRQQVVRLLVGLNLVAYLASLLSANWDTAEHVKGAVDSFWYPPHFGIYFSLLAAMLVSCAGIFIVLQSPGTIGEKLRQHMALVALTVANIIGFTGAPFDAWWHETFGIDLTVWSPPHLHLIFGSALVVVCCSVYFLDNLPVDTPLQRLTRLNQRQLTLIYALGLALLLGSLGFWDYEILPRRNLGSVPAGMLEVLARPSWSYPIAWAAFTLFMLALIAGSTRIVGMVSITTGVFVLGRLMLLALARNVHGFEGVPFYPLLIPALVFDGVLALIALRWQAHRAWLAIGAAGAAATAALIVTVPMVWSFLPALAQLNVYPWYTYWPAVGIIGIVFGLLGWWGGTGLRKLRPDMF